MPQIMSLTHKHSVPWALQINILTNDSTTTLHIISANISIRSSSLKALKVLRQLINTSCTLKFNCDLMLGYLLEKFYFNNIS